MTKEYGKIGFHFIFDYSKIRYIKTLIMKKVKIVDTFLDNWEKMKSKEVDKKEVGNKIDQLAENEEIRITCFEKEREKHPLIIIITNKEIEVYLGLWPHQFHIDELDLEFFSNLFSNCSFCLYGLELETRHQSKQKIIDDLICNKEYPFFIFDLKDDKNLKFSIKNVDPVKNKILEEALVPFRDRMENKNIKEVIEGY